MRIVERKRKQKDISENKTKDLLSYLYLPIQRIIAYHSLLKNILHLTPPDHPDYDHLSNAYQSLVETQYHANHRAQQRKNIDKIIEIQNSLLGQDAQLILPHRRYVYEGEVILGKNLKDRYIYLFNDLLLCTKKKGKFLKIDFIEPLETLKVADVKEEFRQFRLQSSSNEYIIMAEDKQHWIKTISGAIKALKSGENDSKINSHNHIEESTRESLMNRIITWSKMEDPQVVLREIKDLAATLEKYRAIN
eukprot:TRINITY_DN3529_c0_g1_i3.p1 TRINITY_DN3529_c0_g1~~TRINITY_DN3529_c0_g1_i3.p1  ORF type:complete len:249 (-),score=47.52 TRINITY_DN3529_c0_g1_i3:198-944(-)